MDTTFKEIDHSGDVGIEARGADAVAALENATRGLLSLMVREPGKVLPRVERSIAIDAPGDGDLVVDWLSEVITAVSTHGEVYGTVEIRRTGPHSVRGVLRGEPIDEARHGLRFEVKAATYHGLEVDSSKKGCRIRVIFDL
jgi:SHS2 domain-containing protein